MGKTFRANDDNAHKYRKSKHKKKKKLVTKTSYLDENSTPATPSYQTESEEY